MQLYECFRLILLGYDAILITFENQNNVTTVAYTHMLSVAQRHPLFFSSKTILISMSHESWQ